ncbi:phiSA1p31-related protein [Streptomyces lavenduligriseus]|nr:phiSA1p31-related protein [Streptomyces lavenduligriseus]
MTERFEVGQKVKHNVRGDAEVTYGPYTNTFGRVHYVIRLASGRELDATADQLSAIPEPPKFSVGDKVLHRSFGSGVVAFGPFKHINGPDHYLMEDDDGDHILSSSDALTAAEPEPIKVGDRVRIVKDDPTYRTGDFVGVVGILRGIEDDGRTMPYRVELPADAPETLSGRWWCAAVERVATEEVYEHDGVAYDLSAKYQDKDGDPLTIKIVDGVARAAWFGVEPSYDSDSLAYVVRNYGPLTRVSD